MARLAAHWLLTSAAAMILAGCATPPSAPDAGSAGTPSTAGLDASTTSVNGNQPAGARLVFPGTNEPSAALGSIVVTNPLAPRTVDLTAHADDIWDRVRMGFAIPNIDTPLVAEKQAWYLTHQDYLQRAVDRSSRYLYHVVEELEKRHMPTELALLPFIESAYNPMAYSRSHASGIWQFIPSTGKNYNLKQDWWRDERRDVIASTDAALNYLQVLYEMHGDWHLALASYNWGEGAVTRAIARNTAAGKPTDYLSLNMPDETRNYIPKLQALKNIIANPAAFGIVLPRIDNQPYFVTIARTRDIDVRTAAKLAEMPLEEFVALNPSYNRPIIQGTSGATLLLPTDRAALFQANLNNQTQPLATWQAHTVARGERIEKIAARYGMTVSALRQVNGLGARGAVKPGQTLLVQKSGGEAGVRTAVFEPPASAGDTGTNKPAGGLKTVTAAPAASTGRSYMVRRGDTLFAIAKRFNVSVDNLRQHNGLASAQVSVGQKLAIPGSAPSAGGGGTRKAAR